MKDRSIVCPIQSDDSMDILLDYSAGKLDRVRTALFEQHMLACADCSAFLAGQTELWQTLDLWEPEPISMDFNRRLWQRIEQPAKPWYSRLGEFLQAGAWKPALPLTAAVFLVATAFVMDHSKPVPRETETAGSAAQTLEIDADQVERTLDDIQLLGQLDSSNAPPVGSRRM